MRFIYFRHNIGIAYILGTLDSAESQDIEAVRQRPKRDEDPGRVSTSCDRDSSISALHQSHSFVVGCVSSPYWLDDGSGSQGLVQVSRGCCGSRELSSYSI